MSAEPHDPQPAGAPRARSRRRIVIALALVLVLAAAAVIGHRVCTAAMSCSQWTTVYDGYGSVSCDGDAVTLRPEVATATDVTHAGLATAKRASVTEGTTTSVTATLTTNEQLRQGSEPNTWEVPWLLWSYTDDSHFYAIVLKPNGWELSKQDPAYSGEQHFLDTGSSPTFAVGQPHTLTVTVTTEPASAQAPSGSMTVDITADGEHLLTYTDTDSPYLSGPFAAYTEDADVTLELTDATSS